MEEKWKGFGCLVYMFLIVVFLGLIVEIESKETDTPRIEVIINEGQVDTVYIYED